jgi:hypothetical protein
LIVLFPRPLFEDIRQALRDLMHGNVAPEDRRDLLYSMRDTLVRARMGLDDLRDGIATTRRRLEKEQAELDTVRRRKGLAEKIGDAETVTVASRFEVQHSERVAVLTRKLEAQESELALLEREVQEMTEQWKAASAGIGSGASGGAGITGMEPELDDTKTELERELGQLDRAQRRAAARAEAEERLAELKRRMGK